MYRRFTSAIALLCLLVCLGWASTASAQSPAFQVEQFEPLPTQRTNLLNIARSAVVPHLEPSVGLFLHYVDEPLRVRDGASGQIESSLLASQLKAEFSAGIGLFDFAEIGLVIPTVMYQSGDSLAIFGQPGQTIGTLALADARVVPKVNIPLPEALDPFGVALLATTYLPLGDTESFNSDGSFRVEPRLAVDWNHNGFVVAGNLGYQLRPETVAQNHVVDDVMRWGVAAEAPVGLESVGAVARNPKVIASLFGNVQLSDDISPSDPSVTLDQSSGSPIELQTAIRAGFPGNLGVIVGGGVGLNDDVGAPAWRVFTSVGYVSTERDADGDGVLDIDDACPDDPEDPDGHRDTDGCPDLDNDGDGLPDADDACPDQAEDVDGFEDADGCPDPDNDADGVPDVDDNCPDTPNPDQRDLDGDAAGDACEDDRDGDGITDEDDNCPDTPNPDQRDLDGDAAGDACEDDRDGDGITDEDDNCPDTPNAEQTDADNDGVGDACESDRDADGVPDGADNCPDTPNREQTDTDADGIGDRCDDDRDGDQIPNDRDDCPDAPETFNQIDDEDGCPDREQVRVTQEKIEIIDRVYFDTGKATIKQRSYSLLNEVASVIEEQSNINKIRIEGHTDSRGAASYNKQLSQRRAEAVRDYLIDRGIGAEILQAKGMGESTPIADNDTEEGRAKNRRVEFNIAGRTQGK